MADQYFFFIVLQVIDNLGPHLRIRRQVFEAIAVAAHGYHVKIFIAAEILGKQEVVVAFPEITADVAFFLRGDALRSGIRIDSFDEDVHASFPRLHEADVFTVGGDLESALLGIAEEVAH